MVDLPEKEFFGWLLANIDTPNRSYFYFDCFLNVPLPIVYCTYNPIIFDLALQKEFVKELNLPDTNRMQILFDFQHLYLIDFQYQAFSPSFLINLIWYPARFFWKFKKVSLLCLVLKFNNKLRYPWAIRFKKLGK